MLVGWGLTPTDGHTMGLGFIARRRRMRSAVGGWVLNIFDMFGPPWLDRASASGLWMYIDA